MSSNDRDQVTLEAIKIWRDGLIDLTGRNRLLNFRKTKTGTLRISVPDCQGVMDRLLTGRLLGFEALEPVKVDEQGEAGTEEEYLPLAGTVSAGASEAIDDSVEQRVLDDKKLLGVATDPTRMGAVLRTLQTRTNQTFLDTGLWTLFLALGNLAWTDPSDKTKRFNSPLLLVPVELVRQPKTKIVELRYMTEDDTVLNPALQLVMSEYGLELPGMNQDTLVNISGFLSHVSKAVDKYPEWRVDETVHLSYFTFHKEAMYRDLLENEAYLLESEHIKAIATSGKPGQTQEYLFEPADKNQIDEYAPPEKSRIILDADASQRTAILAALEGHSFVLDGPPGTGKSQTIANIIASLVAANKSVLFVSEKAAALEVVKNRLEDVGLGHSVLELHSHKATRKEVATTLSESIKARPEAQGRLSEADRRRLYQVRKQLTKHSNAMNEPRQPLGLSLNSAIGQVAKLEALIATPECSAGLSDLDSDQYSAILSNAQELQRAWPSVVQGSSNPWCGVNTSKPLRSEAQAVLDSLDDLELAFEPYKDLAMMLGWDQPSNSERLARLLDHWGKLNPNMPMAWVTEDANAKHLQDAEAVAEAIAQERHAREQATKFCGMSFDSLASQSKQEGPDQLIQRLQAQGVNESQVLAAGESKLRDLIGTFSQASTKAAGLVEATGRLSTLMGIVPPDNTSDVEDLLAVAKVAVSTNRPEGSWLQTEVNPKVGEGIERLRLAVAAHREAKDAAMEYFDEAVLEVDPKGLQIRFANTHKGMRKLGSAYRADLKILGEASQPGIRPKDNIQHLGLAITWKDSTDQLTELEDQFADLLGERYRRDETDWNALGEALNNAELVAKNARADSLDKLTQSIAHGQQQNPEVSRITTEITDQMEEISSIGRYINLGYGLPGRPSLTHIANSLSEATGLLRSLATSVQVIDQALGKGFSCREAIQAMKLTRAWCQAVDHVFSTADNGGDSLGALYTGLDTSPEELREAVAWIHELHTLLEHAPAAEDGRLPARALTELGELSEHPRILRMAHSRWLESLDPLLDAFAEDRRMQLSLDLSTWDDGRELAEFFSTDVAGQAEYFSGSEAIEWLNSWGLADVITNLVDKNAPQTQVADCIRREVLRAWIDEIIEGDRDLRKTGSKSRDALVEEFQRLDRSLIATSVANIIDEVNALRPTTSVGQAQTLVSQGQKKRNLLPIRSLIASTWDVTISLKPVFMMSPLSVSQFLEPHLRFDTVIFDEASQVLPEDAVNSIYRGNQLIVAGDEKQLPPTTFFALADSDDALEELESDAKDFESILDIAKGSAAYQALTLQWHYRSRHEDLITFSNKSFYDGKLITFPSSEQHGDDVGVEFFYVEGGAYGRGGSRKNMVEARFVADRVEHHFDTRPHMSLGVVTFSQTQREAVEAAVNELWDRRPDLFEGLDTSRLEGFFIKNLESVQGDERDVMIFSIGYGPDESGKFTMEFGPVAREGGGRRLNVAVTRARYRNEVVASFRSSQMQPGGTEARRHLANFLDYAERGPVALALDDTESHGPAESPFEESVADWLMSKGWNVVTQVGTLGYRIDMAVRDPQNPGRFLLGVECDGAQYHSSQTARDRDRLRQEVLEGLGWRLHRIWGPAWYRQRSHEEARLSQALDQAMAADPKGRLGGTSRTPQSRSVVAVKEVDLEAIPAWVVPYKVASPRRPPKGVDPGQPEAIPYLKGTIEEVVSVESPVHRDQIEARIREAWGFRKIGSQIRKQVDEAFKRARVHRDGDFYYQGELSDWYEVPTRTHDLASKRDISQIHAREIQDTCWRIVRDATAVDIEQVIPLAARYLGIQQVRTATSEALRKAVDDLCVRGHLELGEDGLLRLDEPPDE